MNPSEYDIARSVADWSVFTLRGWRDGEIQLGSKLVHNIICVMLDVGLPLDDPLTMDIEQDIVTAADFKAEFGKYSIALARLGLLNNSLRKEVFSRLQLPRSELAIMSFGTPYGPDTLERLNLVEALVIIREELTPEQTSDVKGYLKSILTDPTVDTPHDRSYPFYLLSLISPQDVSKQVQACFESVFDKLNDSEEALWYEESVYHNSLVILNTMRTGSVLSDDLRNGIWSKAIPRLRKLASKLISTYGVSPFTMMDNPVFLSDLSPFVRVLTANPVENEQEAYKRILADGSGQSHTRSLQQYDERLKTRSKNEHDLAVELGKSVSKAIEFQAEIQPLSGGYSGSMVYIAVLKTEQPFHVSGERIVFKTDDRELLTKEPEAWQQLKGLGLHDLFAKVISEPRIIQLGGHHRSILLYEHLADYITLKDILSAPLPEDDKLDLLRKVVHRVCKLYSHPAKTDEEQFYRFWEKTRSRIVSKSSELYLLNFPVLATQIRSLVTRTHELLSHAFVSDDCSFAPMHADLNCRNIMLRRSGSLDLDSVKLIDYSTLTIQGDPAIDIGELVEDAVFSVGFVQEKSVVQEAILTEVASSVPWLSNSASWRHRLLLGRVRSASMIARISLIREDGPNLKKASFALTRWKRALDRIEELVATANKEM
jgi:hypothetical protein